ncbi:hexose kinase [Nocardia sp. CA-290969]|uniref:hexose kinase n=1 Tax=Nocardia sp. CA-290969 TaxID=3239986 RepID=UPI003D8C1BED
MILTVTMNPAYDVTYRVENFARGRTHRVRSVEQRLGGKGINVARVLNQLGRYARATGFADHAFAAAAEAELPVDFVHALPWVRRTVVISEADTGTATALREPGARVANPHASEQLEVRVSGMLAHISGLVIAGSLPDGIDPGLPARIAQAALEAGVPTVCDLDGPALRMASRVPGVVLLPGLTEFESLTKSGADTPAALLATARPLVDRGVGAVIVTRGSLGMVAVTPDGAWNAYLPEPLTGNPTGAGDPVSAAVINALSRTDSPDWPEILTDAVATSAASVVIPIAGEIDRRLRGHLAPTVVVEELDTPGANSESA